MEAVDFEGKMVGSEESEEFLSSGGRVGQIRGGREEGVSGVAGFGEEVATVFAGVGGEEIAAAAEEEVDAAFEVLEGEEGLVVAVVAVGGEAGGGGVGDGGGGDEAGAEAVAAGEREEGLAGGAVGVGVDVTVGDFVTGAPGGGGGGGVGDEGIEGGGVHEGAADAGEGIGLEPVGGAAVEEAAELIGHGEGAQAHAVGDHEDAVSGAGGGGEDGISACGEAGGEAGEAGGAEVFEEVAAGDGRGHGGMLTCPGAGSSLIV